MTRWGRHRGVHWVAVAPQKKWHPAGRVRLPSTGDSPASGVGEAAVAAGGLVGEAAVAVPALQEAVRTQDCPCTLSGEEDEEVDARSEWSMTTFRPGDSVAAWSEPDDMVGPDDDEAAVAADDCPTRFITRFSTRQPRDCTPDQQQLKSKWAGRNDADHVGNIGWLFGNWGKRLKM